MFHYNRILVLAPHTDDGELGCGGALAKLTAEGKEVYYAAFSLCEESLPEGLPPNTLEIELKNATRKLGIPEANLFIFNFKVRYFARDRQDILEEMIRLKKQVRPDLVFLPSQDDIHQDHMTISNEGIRAFKHSSILGYEMPWNNFTFKTSCFISLSDQHLQQKIAAVDEYKSQSKRSYITGESISAVARMRGMQCGSPFAEAFEGIRIQLG